MKRRTILTVAAACLSMVLCLGLAGCGGEKMQYEGLNLDDYITPGDYKGLEVDGYKIKVSEQEIQEKVEAALDEATEHKKLKDGSKLKKGDTANIDFEGKVKGKPFDGGTSKGFDLELGSGSLIDGFEDGLIGRKIGETLDLNLTFPEDYQAEKLAGKDVVFTVTINSATRPKKPEYTEDFVKANTKFKTKEEYEKSLEDKIYKEKEADAKTQQKTSLWSDALDKTKMKKYPEAEMEAYKTCFDAQIDTMAEQAGMTRSEALKQMYGTDDAKTINSVLEDSVKTLIKQEMLVEYIAKAENLSYTDEELEKEVAEVESQGYDDETVKSYTGRTMEQYAHIKILYDKVQDFMLENAKVKN